MLDWNLDDNSGVYLLQRIRAGGQPAVPILIASARDREYDVLTAFRHGADAYMVKPLAERELVARVEALARRRKHRTRPPVALLNLGAYHLDTKTRTVLRHGDAVELTAKDFDLAVLFLHNVGRLLSHRDICESVWGPDLAVSACNVNTCVSRLRNRLRLTPDNGWRLAAVYGYGYRLQQVEAAQGIRKRV